MQDHMIGVRPEDPDSAHAFVMKCKSCDYHRFYGRSDADMSNEKGAPGWLGYIGDDTTYTTMLYRGLW